MDWTALTLHTETLHTIIDAAIPNKSQNAAVKVQVAQAVNELMNRIAQGWINQQSLDTLQSPETTQTAGPTPPAGTVLCGDNGRIVGVSDGSTVLRVDTA